MTKRALLCAAFLLSPAAIAADSEDRTKLAGDWELQDGRTDSGIWTLEMRDQNIRVSMTRGDQKVTFECNTLGRECAGKDGSKVSLWFNGPKLVELETKGSAVTRRRFKIDAAGDGMEVEVTPVSPSGKDEVLHFKRVKTAKTTP